MRALWLIFKKGLVAENPIFVLALSLCPALAVTTTIANALTMGLSVMFVISCNNFIVSLTRRLVNPKVRVPIYITSIATVVTVVELLLRAFLPLLYAELGIYLQLIVVFAIILARAEVFASKHPPVPAFFDGFGMGCGFTFAMLLIGAIRELLGAGTLLGHPIFGPDYPPALIMVLPPGAFILIGYLVGCAKMYNDYMEKKQNARARAK